MKHENTKPVTTYYLLPGTNQITLCKYDVLRRKMLSSPYKAEVIIEGDLAGFLRQYPGSFISIENGTTE